MATGTYWAVETVEFVGDYGEYNLFRVVCICKTEEEADRRGLELKHKYGLCTTQQYTYGEDIG